MAPLKLQMPRCSFWPVLQHTVGGIGIRLLVDYIIDFGLGCSSHSTALTMRRGSAAPGIDNDNDNNNCDDHDIEYNKSNES